MVTASQALFCLLGVLGLRLKDTRVGRHKLFTLPAYVYMVNKAALVATWNLLRGHQIVLWEPQREEAEAGNVPHGESVGMVEQQ